MQTMQVVYRQEEGGWSARVPEAPGYTAFAESFGEIVHLAREGVPFFVGEPVTLQEYVDTAGGLALSSGVPRVSVTFTPAGSVAFATVPANTADRPSPAATPLPKAQPAPA